MPECCCPAPGTMDEGAIIRCVGCRTNGQAVDALTVKALVTESALTRFEPGRYRFCPDSKCDVVYFSEHGTTFSRTDLRVSVWQKEAAGGRTICFCFDENERDIAEEIDRTDESQAVTRVRKHITAGRCACEVRNPRGVCCLGDLTNAVERLRQERRLAKGRS